MTGPLPTYQMIDLAQTFVPDYQRKRNPKKIKRLVDHFNSVKVRPPLVNDRGDGTYAMVDGQHTTETLKIKGYRVIPMAVICVPVDEENELFSTQHENKDAISPLERLWADYCGENGRSERAHGILDSITDARWSYSRDKVKGPRTVVHSTGLEEVYDKWGGAEAVRNVITVIDQAWGHHAEAPDPGVARAVGKLLSEYPLTPVHIRTLSKFDLSKMIYKRRGKGAQRDKRDVFAEEIRKDLASHHAGFTARGVFRTKKR